MRTIILTLMTCLILAWQPAGAVTINPNQNLGAVPVNPGTGLLGSYYKFGSNNIGTLAQANALISSSGGPTATFSTTTVCFPDCNGGTIDDSSTVPQFLNGHASNFAYTAPGSQIPPSLAHSAIVLTGYIAISQAGSYTFNLGSDDGSQLMIGGQTVVGNDNDHSYQVNSGTATFSAPGLYAISLLFFEDSGSSGLELSVGGSAATKFYSSLPATATPEPASIALFAAGLGALAWARRRRSC